VSARVHSYEAQVAWTGSTAAGYERYDRAHAASCPPAETELELSSDPAFGGDPARLNPEQLLVAAASSCQLLSFLAVAARARIDVRGYRDAATGTMDEGDPPVRIGRIVLRPRIEVTPGPSEERVRELCDVAHRHCFVSNSLRTDVVVEPEVEFAGG
jgi:organic hydroperoxide reductase OsmC/OhrA